MHHHPTLVHTRDDKLGTWFGCQIQIKHWTRAIPVTLGLRLPHFSCRVYWLVHENLALQVSQQLQMDTLVWNLEALEAMRIEYRWCAGRHTSLCIRVTGLEQVGHMPHFNAICVSRTVLLTLFGLYAALRAVETPQQKPFFSLCYTNCCTSIAQTPTVSF